MDIDVLIKLSVLVILMDAGIRYLFRGFTFVFIVDDTFCTRSYLFVFCYNG